MKNPSKILAILFTAAVLLGFDASGQAFLTNGLVAYYPFNGNANDAAGTNNGTVNGAGLTVNRFQVINSAYDFNGISSFIQIPNSTNLFGSGSFTISIWFNTSKYPDSNLTNQAAFLFSKGRNVYEIHLASPPIIYTGIRFLPTQESGTSYYEDALSANFKTNTWYQIIAIWNKTNHVAQLFFNGQLLSGSTLTGSDTADNTTPARIGMRYNGPGGTNSAVVVGGNGLPFKGILDDIRIYNRALSTSEASQLYAIEAQLPTMNIASTTNGPAVFYTSTNGSVYTIQMATNLASPVWATVTNGVPVYGLQITNPPSNAFFRVVN